MKLSSLFFYRADTTTPTRLNYGTLLGQLARASACVIAMASITTSVLAAGPKVYVGNFKDNSVSVIDTAAGAVVATVPVAAGPDGIAITPNGGTVFVSGASASTMSVIDAATDRVVQTIEVGKGPQGVAMMPDGQLLLVAVNGEDHVALVDTAKHAVVATVPVPKPHTIAIRPDGKQAYITSQDPGHFALAVIDVAARSVVATVPLDKAPRDLEFSHDGNALYFTLAGVNAVQVLDPKSNKIVAEIPTGASPHIANYFAGTTVGVVVVQGPGQLLLFDPATNKPIRGIAVGTRRARSPCSTRRQVGRQAQLSPSPTSPSSLRRLRLRRGRALLGPTTTERRTDWPSKTALKERTSCCPGQRSAAPTSSPVATTTFAPFIPT